MGKPENLSAKEVIDEIVGLMNVLVVRYVAKPDPSKKAPPHWFTDQLIKVDLAVNTMQSAIENPEGEDVSFAFEKLAS